MSSEVQCAPVAQEYLAFRETFEADGYVNAWEEDPTNQGSVDIDPNSPPLPTVPSTWGDQCLRVSKPATGATTQRGRILYQGRPEYRNVKLRLSVYLDEFAESSPANTTTWIVVSESGQTIFDFYVLRTAGGQIEGYIECFASGVGVNRKLNGFALQTLYDMELYWNADDLEWSFSLNGQVAHSGSISGAATGWGAKTHYLGVTQGATQPLSFYFDLYEIRPFGVPESYADQNPADVDIVDTARIPLSEADVEDSYTLEVSGADQLPAVTLPLLGQGASPRRQGQAFQAQTGHLLHSVSFHLTRGGLPLGDILCDVYLATGAPGSRAPAGLSLARSEPFPDAGVATNGVFDEVAFYFNESMYLTPGQWYVAELSIDGQNTGQGSLGVRALAEADSIAPHPGNWEQGGVAGGTAYDLLFTVRSVPAAETPATPSSVETGCAPATATSLIQCDLPAPTPVDIREPFKSARTSEVGRLLGRFAVAEVDRAQVIAALEFIVTREKVRQNLGSEAAEAGLLLERYAITEVDHLVAQSLAEEGLIFGRYAIAIPDDVLITGRELLRLGDESIGLRHEAGLLERALMRARFLMTEADRTVALSFRELIRAQRGISAGKTIGAVQEDALMLERASVSETVRLSVIQARDSIAAREGFAGVASVVILLPRISSVQVIVDNGTSPPKVSCVFMTGQDCESARVDIRVASGGIFGNWTLWESIDTVPIGGPYGTSEYQSAAGQQIQFRVRPYSSDNLAGAEGTTVESEIVYITVQVAKALAEEARLFGRYAISVPSALTVTGRELIRARPETIGLITS